MTMTYKCNVCGKAFPSPQAVGSHKRWGHGTRETVLTGRQGKKKVKSKRKKRKYTRRASRDGKMVTLDEVERVLEFMKRFESLMKK
jgi:hypothetical protein